VIDYDNMMSNPLATRYIAFSLCTKSAILAQFQQDGVEGIADKEPNSDLVVIEHSPEDSRYSPTHFTTTREVESLSQLLEYMPPDWLANNNFENLVEEEARLANAA
jgi:hypothetical protein